MSIQVRTDGETLPWNLKPGQECFFCSNEIKVVAVMWGGNGWDLWLHPKCCQRLMLRLSRDCWEIENKNKSERWEDYETDVM